MHLLALLCNNSDHFFLFPAVRVAFSGPNATSADIYDSNYYPSGACRPLISAFPNAPAGLQFDYLVAIDSGEGFTVSRRLSTFRMTRGNWPAPKMTFRPTRPYSTLGTTHGTSPTPSTSRSAPDDPSRRSPPSPHTCRPVCWPTRPAARIFPPLPGDFEPRVATATAAARTWYTRLSTTDIRREGNRQLYLLATGTGPDGKVSGGLAHHPAADGPGVRLGRESQHQCRRPITSMCRGRRWISSISGASRPASP